MSLKHQAEMNMSRSQGSGPGNKIKNTMGICTVQAVRIKPNQKPDRLLPQSSPTLITIPRPNRLPRQPNTLPMKPLIRTIIIITSNHIPMAYAATSAINLRVFIPLILIIVVKVIPLARILRIRHIRAAEHRVILVVVPAR